MNKLMFWSGFGLFSLEFLGIFIYFISSLDWSWISLQLIMTSIGIAIIILLNLFLFILMIIGALSND